MRMRMVTIMTIAIMMKITNSYDEYEDNNVGEGGRK